MKCLTFLICTLALNAVAAPLQDRGQLTFHSVPDARFKFAGYVGNRVHANVDNWLLRAPQANPGMLEMFRMRDRKPVPQLVPWAGEFVGKYLISAIQALRMTDDPRLEQQVTGIVREFITTQAEDGYLGPFPRESRLLKNWDLWGHYHAIYALLLWHERTGDKAALDAACKAGDLVCRTYLNTGRRVFDAGDCEMNMSILTGLSMLYRVTGEDRYLQMAREVERDWERAGDYLRTGLDGREFFQSPRPRWESIHDLQGLLEQWRITGDSKYREAFLHHWRSIRRWDQRNTGGFSSGEQATGNPFASTAIETCCTVAWIALSLDALRLTGDSTIADDVEISTLNAGLGAQHSSGRWWTYNTPMDGVREASAHTIVFQARAGTPELNCCSVNGPRVLGMLSEWALMSSESGLVLNSYLPGELKAAWRGEPVGLRLERDYPRTNSQRVVVSAGGSKEWTLALRIPGWSRQTRVTASFEPGELKTSPGSYLEIRRQWRAGDSVTLEFDFGVRAVAGANEAAGKVSLYRGPLLLAWDQSRNEIGDEKLPPLDLSLLNDAASIQLLNPVVTTTQPPALVECDVTFGASRLRLVDFASAGSAGAHYRSWFEVTNPLPAPAFTRYPRDGERVPPGPVGFRWRGTRPSRPCSFRVEIADDPSFRSLVLSTNVGTEPRTSLDLSKMLSGGSRRLFWHVVTLGPGGATIPEVPGAWFELRPDAPPQKLPPEIKPGPNGELILHSLRGTLKPERGEVASEKFERRDGEGTKLNGRDQMLVYALSAWPEEDFSVAIRVRIDSLPKDHIGQIFSGWASGMDDPLRLVIDNGKLFARIEAGAVYSTQGTPIQTGQWHHIAAAKKGETLELFLDGQPAGRCQVPQFSSTTAKDFALGGNPHFSGNEFLAATFSDLGFWARALSREELKRLPGTTAPAPDN